MEDYNFDISLTKKIFKDDEESLIDLIKTFLKYTPESLNEMLLKINENNMEEVAFLAHKMIPGISFFGLKEVEKKLLIIEDMAKNNQNPQFIKDELYKTKEIIEHFMTYLRKEFNIKS